MGRESGRNNFALRRSTGLTSVETGSVLVGCTWCLRQKTLRIRATALELMRYSLADGRSISLIPTVIRQFILCLWRSDFLFLGGTSKYYLWSDARERIENYIAMEGKAMQARTMLALTSALMGSAALTSVAALAATPSTCTALAPLMMSSNTYVIAATSSLVAATTNNAAYCNVQLTFSSKSGPAFGYAVGQAQSIKIGVGLPLNSVDGGSGGVQGTWNGRVQNIGGGGNAGSVGSTTSATNAGWVGSSTDGGHTTAENGTLGNFAIIQATNQLDLLGKINDFTWESLHQQYVWALLADQQVLWSSCRNAIIGTAARPGGRQGLSPGQRNGAGDFDGIVAGAPAAQTRNSSWPPAGAEYVNRDDVVGAGHPALTSAQFNLANAHAIAACDVQGLDTVADGVIADPRQCTYSAAADLTSIFRLAGWNLHGCQLRGFQFKPRP